MKKKYNKESFLHKEIAPGRQRLTRGKIQNRTNVVKQHGDFIHQTVESQKKASKQLNFSEPSRPIAGQDWLLTVYAQHTQHHTL